MLKLVVRRLLSAIAVLFVVSLITFVVLLCIPGDPAQLILGVEATPEKVEALRASMGLDRPWYVQYMHWIQGVLTGNWGTSYLYGENVWTLICQRLPVTFSVALLSMAAALVVSAILGILAVRCPLSGWLCCLCCCFPPIWDGSRSRGIPLPVKISVRF